MQDRPIRALKQLTVVAAVVFGAPQSHFKDELANGRGQLLVSLKQIVCKQALSLWAGMAGPSQAMWAASHTRWVRSCL